MDTVETDVFETAKRVLPGGTFGNFAAEVVIREGKAGRVWDENGKEYIDYVASWDRQSSVTLRKSL